MSGENESGYVPVSNPNERSSIARLTAEMTILWDIWNQWWNDNTELPTIREQLNRVQLAGNLVTIHVYEHIYNGFQSTDIFAHLAE